MDEVRRQVGVVYPGEDGLTVNLLRSALRSSCVGVDRAVAVDGDAARAAPRPRGQLLPATATAPPGVFGVLATGFSVLLGFIIFLAFQAYDDTRAGRRDRGRGRGPDGADRPADAGRLLARSSPAS